MYSFAEKIQAEPNIRTCKKGNQRSVSFYNILKMHQMTKQKNEE